MVRFIWAEFFSIAAGFVPIPRLFGHTLIAVFFGFACGGLTAYLGLVPLAPYVSAGVFFIYVLIAVLVTLHRRPKGE